MVTPCEPPRAVFLDRDGTLIENRHYLRSADGVSVLPGVRQGLSRLREIGAKLFLLTNQSGVGRGYFTLADVEAQNRRMIQCIGLGDDLFTRICVAPEHPDDPPVYRKPSPRFIHEMLLEHAIPPAAAWMVGDSPVDWQAGLNAGIRAAAIMSTGSSETERALRSVPGIEVHESLLAWVTVVCG